MVEEHRNKAFAYCSSCALVILNICLHTFVFDCSLSFSSSLPLSPSPPPPSPSPLPLSPPQRPNIRRTRVLSHIAATSPDVVCFQELSDVDEGWNPHLKKMEYDGFSAQRTAGPGQYNEDGCGIYWKRDKLDLVARVQIPYHCYPQHRRKDHLAIACLLRVRDPSETSSSSSSSSSPSSSSSSTSPSVTTSSLSERKGAASKRGWEVTNDDEASASTSSSSSSSTRPPQYVCVVTTHILYNGNRGEVKLAQAQMMMLGVEAWLCKLVRLPAPYPRIRVSLTNNPHTAPIHLQGQGFRSNNRKDNSSPAVGISLTGTVVPPSMSSMPLTLPPPALVTFAPFDDDSTSSFSSSSNSSSSSSSSSSALASILRSHQLTKNLDFEILRPVMETLEKSLRKGQQLSVADNTGATPSSSSSSSLSSASDAEGGVLASASSSLSRGRTPSPSNSPSLSPVSRASSTKAPKAISILDFTSDEAKASANPISLHGPVLPLSALDNMTLIVTGDFNSTPDSALTYFARSGMLPLSSLPTNCVDGMKDTGSSLKTFRASLYNAQVMWPWSQDEYARSQCESRDAYVTTLQRAKSVTEPDQLTGGFTTRGIGNVSQASSTTKAPSTNDGTKSSTASETAPKSESSSMSAASSLQLSASAVASNSNAFAFSSASSSSSPTTITASSSDSSSSGNAPGLEDLPLAGLDGLDIGDDILPPLPPLGFNEGSSPLLRTYSAQSPNFDPVSPADPGKKSSSSSSAPALFDLNASSLNTSTTMTTTPANVADVTVTYDAKEPASKPSSDKANAAEAHVSTISLSSSAAESHPAPATADKSSAKHTSVDADVHMNGKTEGVEGDVKSKKQLKREAKASAKSKTSRSPGKEDGEAVSSATATATGDGGGGGDGGGDAAAARKAAPEAAASLSNTSSTAAATEHKHATDEKPKPAKTKPHVVPEQRQPVSLGTGVLSQVFTPVPGYPSFGAHARHQKYSVAGGSGGGGKKSSSSSVASLTLGRAVDREPLGTDDAVGVTDHVAVIHPIDGLTSLLDVLPSSLREFILAQQQQQQQQFQGRKAKDQLPRRLPTPFATMHHSFACLESAYHLKNMPPAYRPSSCQTRGKFCVDHILFGRRSVGAMMRANALRVQAVLNAATTAIENLEATNPEVFSGPTPEIDRIVSAVELAVANTDSAKQYELEMFSSEDAVAAAALTEAAAAVASSSPSSSSMSGKHPRNPSQSTSTVTASAFAMPSSDSSSSSTSSSSTSACGDPAGDITNDVLGVGQVASLRCVLDLPDDRLIMKRDYSLPNEREGSDHFSLIATLELRPARR